MNQSDDGKFSETNELDSSANLDPRIGMRLEDLNKWTGKINALEKSFEEANSNFRLILSESTDRLKSLAAKLGKSVDESRPYYEAKERLIEVQIKCQRAAINYDKACQAYLEAKERINLAEKKFSTNSNEFDATWQEMLNQANIKLMEAEAMKKESERLHQLSMKDFHSAEAVVANLEKKLKGALQKSKIYFDEKRRFQEKLALVKEDIELTISQINCSKARYASTLKELEAISEEIHEKRNCSLLQHLKREPGDGAEFKPEMISLDSCELLINSQLAELDLKINESLNCLQSERFETPTEPKVTSQASTSDAIINCPSRESQPNSIDKHDKEGEVENLIDDYKDIADDKEPSIGEEKGNKHEKVVILMNGDKDVLKNENDHDDENEEEKDEDKRTKNGEKGSNGEDEETVSEEDDVYEDVTDEIKTSQNSGSTYDQTEVSRRNGLLQNGPKKVNYPNRLK